MARASCDERPRPLGVSSWAVREPCRGIRNNGFDDRCYEFRSSDTAHTGQYDRGADMQVGRRLLFAELLARPVTSKFICVGKGPPTYGIPIQLHVRNSGLTRPLLRHLLAEYHDTCERILDEREIEVGLWAYKKRSQGLRRRQASF